MKNRIKELRELRGISQGELGKKVSASRQAINAVETGKYNPSITLAYKIAKYFELPIEDIFDFSECV